MQAARSWCLLALSVLCPVINAASSSTSISPVTRVVELLNSLAAEVEKEGKKEKDLYETYVCWGKTIINEKTASNTAAQNRIEQLESYIADLDAGRITLTSERADLELEIEGLQRDLENADAMRKKDHKDFLEAEDEMTKAIAALDSAIEVLEEATKDHKDGVLLTVRQKLNGGIEEMTKEQSNLIEAVNLGQRFLTKADSFFLQRVLLGDVPTVDWKKLNRKATFKMSYKARSLKIQEILNKMHITFETNLEEARTKEANDQAAYEKLSDAKNGQLDAAREALEKMALENGARGLSRQECQDEVDSLKIQVANDKKFIEETKASLKEKEGEWKVRSELRSSELSAITKAISILHNDDARDLFKRSFSSQGFLQIEMITSQKAANGAAAALREAARKSGDERLMALAKALADPASAKTRFAPVIEAIDKMIAMLHSEENKDLEIKESCEEDRMSDTRKAVLASRAIDDMTDTVVSLKADIAKLEAQIEELQAEQKKIKEQVEAATRIREDEHAAWLMSDKDDEAAAATVLNAKEVLQSFYAENNLVLTQKGKGLEPGEAPPPPPPTWEGGYGGKPGEAQGIVAIMDMVHQDILKDRAAAKAEEDKSKQEYDEFKESSEEQIKTLEGDENEKEKVKGEKVTEKTDTEKERGTKKEELDVTLDKIHAVNPNCEYFEVNYVLRVKDRQIELDGLQKAKAILEGGTFSEGPDPDREIKPGDAANFLQRRAK
jgi:hypothetical protein